MENKRFARIAVYRLSERDVHRIADLPGVNNSVRPGDEAAMLITRDWGDGEVNGRVFLDGEDTLWITSVKEGSGVGQYSVAYRLGEIAFGPSTAAASVPGMDIERLVKEARRAG